MKNIKNYNLEELKNELKELGEKPFRAEHKLIIRTKRKAKRKLYNM